MKTWRNSWFIACKGGYFNRKVVNGVEFTAFLNLNLRKEWVLKVNGNEVVTLRDNATIKGFEGVTKSRIYHLFYKKGKMLLCSKEIPVVPEEEKLKFIEALQALKEAK